MLKRFLLAFLLLFIASPVMAQAWTEGAQPVNYPKNASDGSENVTIGDGSDAQGGVAPGYAYEAADIASNFTLSPWMTTAGAFRVAAGPGVEAKFRTHCNPSHEKREDPILFPGQANVGHDHTFFGNSLAGKDSTYTSLRTTGKGTCAGGAVNRTAYWIPSMKELLSSGATVTRKFDFAIVYYTVTDASNSPKNSRFPRNFAYIGGVNPSDYNDTARKAEVPGGYAYIGNGFQGWQCQNSSLNPINTSGGQAYSKRLVNADGSDPWAGACDSGKYLVAVVDAPTCWDGHNIRSPDGRSHLRYPIRNIQTGHGVCPDHWYQFPAFQGSFVYSHTGFSEYSKWYLSSDRMNPAGTAADATSLSPCRQIGPWFCPGETFHFDWFGAWDYGTAASPGVMLKWLVNCTGTKIVMSGTTLAGNPGTCDDSTFDAVPTRLLTNGATSPDTSLSLNPVISFVPTYNLPATTRFFPILPGQSGDFTIHHHVGGMAANDNFALPSWANDNQPVSELTMKLAAAGGQ